MVEKWAAELDDLFCRPKQLDYENTMSNIVYELGGAVLALRVYLRARSFASSADFVSS